jgi:hypothetical protein
MEMMVQIGAFQYLLDLLCIAGHCSYVIAMMLAASAHTNGSFVVIDAMLSKSLLDSAAAWLIALQKSSRHHSHWIMVSFVGLLDWCIPFTA